MDSNTVNDGNASIDEVDENYFRHLGKRKSNNWGLIMTVGLIVAGVWIVSDLAWRNKLRQTYFYKFL